MSLKQLMQNEFKNNNKKYKHVDTGDLGKHFQSISHPTGHLVLDYALGTISTLESIDDNGAPFTQIYEQIGIRSGSIIQFAGPTQSGKSTIARSICCNIAKRYPKSTIIDENPEGGMNYQWLKTVSGWTDDMIEEKYVLNTLSTLQTFLDNFKLMVAAKREGIKNDPNNYLFNTKLKDKYGQPIYHPIPSFIIIDSWKHLSDEKIFERDTDNFTNNMDAATSARVKGNALQNIIQECRIYNIIIICINHEQGKIETSMFKKTKSQFLHGDNDSYLPGGKNFHHSCDEIIVFRKGKVLDPEKDDLRIEGHICEMIFNKVRSSKNAGMKYQMAFVKGEGFNNHITLYYMLKQYDLITSSTKPNIYGFSDYKFYQKNFIEDFKNNYGLREAFKKVSILALSIVMGITTKDKVKARIDNLKK